MRVSLIRFYSVSASNSGINLDFYPLDNPHSQEYSQLVKRGADMLSRTGCATFPAFLTDDATEAACLMAQRSSRSAFVTNDKHNAYQLPKVDETLPINHVRNLEMNTQVASIAFDEMLPTSPLRRLYAYEGLVQFIGDVVGKSLHRISDPLGACTVNIFRSGWEHAWHFDESEFTTTLCLQQADVGGNFEFSHPLRNCQEELAISEVTHILSHHSEYSPLEDCSSQPSVVPTITTANFEPGTLQIFAGRYSLHRVTRIDSEKERLVAVLCFGTEPGIINSHTVQQMFWGRTSDDVIDWTTNT